MNNSSRQSHYGNPSLASSIILIVAVNTAQPSIRCCSNTTTFPYQYLVKEIVGPVLELDPWDNTPVQAFFKTIKAELIWRMKFETRIDAERKIFGYINDFYNPRRRHSALGNICPAAYVKLAA